MKIILLKEIPGLGRAGDTKEVKDGYAKNFLIPKNLAKQANKHTLRVWHDQKEKQGKQNKKKLIKKESLAKKINGKNFEITAKADEKGTLYAGLDAKLISQELNKQGIKVEESDFEAIKKIKTLGEHAVKLDLAGNKITIKLNIKS